MSRPPSERNVTIASVSSRWLVAAACALFVFVESSGAQDTKPTPHSIFALTFSPDGKLLAAASNSMDPPGPIVLWNVDDWSIAAIHRPDAGSIDLDFSPTGDRLAYATKGGKVGIFDIGRQMLLREIDVSAKTVFSVAFAPDGKSLVSAGDDNRILQWNAETGALMGSFEGHTDKVTGVAISPDGKTLLSGSTDETARLWNIESRETLMTFQPSSGIVRRVSFTDDGTHFLTSRWDAKVRIRDTRTGQLKARFHSGSDGADITSNNRLVATTGFGSTAFLYAAQLNAATSEDHEQIDALLARFSDPSTSYENREEAARQIETLGMIAEPQLREAMHAEDAELRVRARRLRDRVRSREPFAKLGGHRGDVEVVCFSPDGRLLATGCRGGDVKVWEMSNHREQASLQIPR